MKTISRMLSDRFDAYARAQRRLSILRGEEMIERFPSLQEYLDDVRGLSGLNSEEYALFQDMLPEIKRRLEAADRAAEEETTRKVRRLSIIGGADVDHGGASFRDPEQYLEAVERLGELSLEEQSSFDIFRSDNFTVGDPN